MPDIPNATPRTDCYCPEHMQVLSGAALRNLNDMSQGHVETWCRLCKRHYRYEIVDYKMTGRRELAVH